MDLLLAVTVRVQVKQPRSVTPGLPAPLVRTGDATTRDKTDDSEEHETITAPTLHELQNPRALNAS